MTTHPAPYHIGVPRLVGVGLLMFAAWLYAQRQLVPVMGPVLRAGDAQAVLVSNGGRLTGNDYLHIYLGSRLLWQHQNPYDPALLIPAGLELVGRGPLPYVYLPFTGFVMGSLAALDYAPSLLVWFVISHLFMLAAIPVGLKALRMPISAIHVAFGLLVLAVSEPLFRTVSAGQLNAPLAFGYALFFLLLGRVHASIVGIVGSGLMLFKLTPGILLLYLLWTRRWREALWMAGWAVGLTLLMLALFGLKVHLEFIPMLRDMGYGRSTWSEFGHAFFTDPFNQSFNSLFHHLFAKTPVTEWPLWLVGGKSAIGARVANALTWIASLSLIALVLGFTRGVSRDHGNVKIESLTYSLFIFLSLLLPSLMWDHYLIQLFFPILILYRQLQLERSRSIAILIALVCIFGLSLVSMRFAFGHPMWTRWPGMLLMSLKLCGTLILFACNLVLLIRARRLQRAAAGIS